MILVAPMEGNERLFVVSGWSGISRISHISRHIVVISTIWTGWLGAVEPDDFDDR